MNPHLDALKESLVSTVLGLTPPEFSSKWMDTKIEAMIGKALDQAFLLGKLEGLTLGSREDSL